MMTYRSSAHSTAIFSPSLLFLKRELCTRFDLLRPDPEARVQDKLLQQKRIMIIMLNNVSLLWEIW